MNGPKTLVLLTVLFWSIGPLLTRLISIDSQLLSLTILFFFTFIFFLCYFLFENRREFFSTLQKIRLKYLFFGLFGYFFYYLGLVQSFHLYNSASVTTILNYTFPIFTVIFTELFLRRKQRNRGARIVEYLGVFFGFAAVIVLATRGNLGSLQILNAEAFLWGLSAGVSYGIFSTYSSTVPKKEQNIFLLASIFSSLLLSIVIAIPEIHEINRLDIKEYGILAFLAFVVNGFGYIAWTRANRIAGERNIPIARLASLLFILPFLSLVVISIFLRENYFSQGYFITCLVFIFISTLLCQRSEYFSKLFQNKK